MADGSFQIRHLHRRQRRFQSLVPHLQTGAINRLLQRLAGQHTKRMRDTGLLRRLPDAPRNFIHDDVIVRRVAAQQTTNTENRVVLPSFGKRARGQRDFECPGNSDQRDVFLLRARAQQSVVSALKETFRDEGVEARDDNSKPPSISAEAALDSRNRRLSNTFGFYLFFRAVLRASVSPWWILLLTL